MDSLTNLAKLAVENYIENKEIISPPEELPQEFLVKKSGTFIIIKKSWKLRACMGTYLPTKENIAEEVINNAISAATKDYRFGPIEKEELESLSYVVCILEKPERIERLEDLNPKIHGVLVKTSVLNLEEKNVSFNGRSPFKSGIILSDFGNTKTSEQQFYSACQKAGIDPKGKDVILYRFLVKKYE